jgi:hypothetical protein
MLCIVRVGATTPVDLTSLFVHPDDHNNPKERRLRVFSSGLYSHCSCPGPLPSHHKRAPDFPITVLVPLSAAYCASTALEFHWSQYSSVHLELTIGVRVRSHDTNCFVSRILRGPLITETGSRATHRVDFSDSTTSVSYSMVCVASVVLLYL